MAMDPVCEMDVNEQKADFVTTYEGQSYYFCSRSCQNEFDQDPGRYVGPLLGLEFPAPEYVAGGTPPNKDNGDEGLFR